MRGPGAERSGATEAPLPQEWESAEDEGRENR